MSVNGFQADIMNNSVLCIAEENGIKWLGSRLNRMELSNWTIFSLLDKEFAAQIRLACVFGKGNQN
jgi:hypothetical protein